MMKANRGSHSRYQSTKMNTGQQMGDAIFWEADVSTDLSNLRCLGGTITSGWETMSMRTSSEL